MTAARIRAQFPTSDGFGDQLKGCCRPPFVWASYNISRYIGRHSSRENNAPRPGVRIKHVHGIFKGRRERTRTGQKVPRFPAQPTLSPDKPIPGSAEGVNEKRQLSPGLSPTSPIALVSPLKYPRPGAGILTRFPFDSGGTEAASSERTSPIS